MNVSEYKTRLLVLVCLYLLSGCASNSDNQGAPEWVLIPAQDSQEYMYGIGVGRSLEEAKQHALKEIASKFSVSVNSDTFHQQSLHNGQVDQLFTQNVNTQVKNIEFSKVEQKRVEVINDQYFVEVAISKQEFVKEKKSKLAIITNEINTSLNDIEKRSKIEQLYGYNKIQANIRDAEPLLYLIAVADSDFDIEAYTEQFHEYSLMESNLLASTHFFIQSPQILSPIAERFSDLIQTYGFQVNSNKFKADAIIKLQGKVKNNKAFSSYGTRIDFSFFVLSKGGSVYSKKPYTLNGASISNFDRAYENAVNKYLGLVEKRSDIYQLLGFEG